MNVYGAMVEDTGGENWSREWKILYTVGGREINVTGAVVGTYLQGKSEVLGEKCYTDLLIDKWMIIKQYYKDTEWRSLILGEKNYTVW